MNRRVKRGIIEENIPVWLSDAMQKAIIRQLVQMLTDAICTT